MKLDAPINENYAVSVVKVTNVRDLEGMDNVKGVAFFGLQAIVDKSVQVGDIGLFFPAESQISEDFAHNNNLYRHADRNKVESESGYFEDNRRVKAMKFRGHQSDAFFIPLTSLSYLGIDPDQLGVGDTFDTLLGHEICRKYLVKQPGVNRVDKNASKKFVRVESKFMPEHYDTDNWWRNEHVLADNTEIIVTQKLHGTSIRIGNTVVKRQLGWKDRLAKRLGVAVNDTEYDHVYGSRKVIKDVNNPDQAHFYSVDLWSETGRKYDDIIPENFLVYGEVIGYSNDTPIQKNYTYGYNAGENELYVYRVAVITNQGRIVDLSWDQVMNFCEDAGLKHVPELWRGAKKDFNVDDFIDVQFKAKGYANAVDLAAGKKFVDEGVVVRAEGRAPYLLKAKSPIFLTHESKMLDEEATDLEAEESVVDA